MTEVKPASGHTLVLASGNAGKLRELGAMLEPLGWKVAPQSDWDVPEAVEDGLSFIENALIKARHASMRTGLPALADDSGLVVDALQGAPGIYSDVMPEPAPGTRRITRNCSANSRMCLNPGGKLISTARWPWCGMRTIPRPCWPQVPGTG